MTHINSGMYTTDSVEWYTPEWIIKKCRQIMPVINLDPASNGIANQIVKAEHFYSYGGLNKSWRRFGPDIFLNPPYGREIGDWIDKALHEAYHDHRILMLLPARTDTAWFRKLWGWPMAFIYGRVKFWTCNDNTRYIHRQYIAEPDQSAPFPSVIVGINIPYGEMDALWGREDWCYVVA